MMGGATRSRRAEANGASDSAAAIASEPYRNQSHRLCTISPSRSECEINADPEGVVVTRRSTQAINVVPQAIELQKTPDTTD